MPNFQFLQYLAFGRSPAGTQYGIYGGKRGQKFKEEPMKSLSEVAAIYERWATANEATAEEILACLDSFVDDLQEQQRWRAGQLVADAEALKTRAAELRQLEDGMVELLEVPRTPQDRDLGCDRLRTTHQNRFR
jgi:hypothetical protein